MTRSRPRNLDLFAGMGGWAEGARAVGLRPAGIELDADACASHAAAGGRVIRGDIATMDPDRFARAEGLIASPPCTDFSSAGNRAGINGETGALIFEVPRWVNAIRPRWVACEQVPPVLGWWETFAREFREAGYRTWTGILNAADVGVPQTRRRAFLLASLDFQPYAPVATHARNPAPSLFGPELLSWVSMANALGWDGFEARYRRGAAMIARYGKRPARDCSLPSPTLTSSALGAGGGAKMTFVRTLLHTNRGQTADGQRQTRDTPAPAPALSAKAGGQWMFDRPATTVCADPRLGDPGHRDSAGGERQFSGAAIRLTERDALILQSFRPDYPLVGNKTSRFRQIGNACPPLLARRVLEQFASSTAAGVARPEHTP